MVAPGRPRGRFLLPVLVLLGVTLVTLSERTRNGGIFAKAGSHGVAKRGHCPPALSRSTGSVRNTLSGEPYLGGGDLISRVRPTLLY